MQSVSDVYVYVCIWEMATRLESEWRWRDWGSSQGVVWEYSRLREGVGLSGALLKIWVTPPSAQKSIAGARNTSNPPIPHPPTSLQTNTTPPNNLQSWRQICKAPLRIHLASMCRKHARLCGLWKSIFRLATSYRRYAVKLDFMCGFQFSADSL